MPELIRPNQASIPAGLSLIGLEGEKGLVVLSRRLVVALVLHHAILTRESSTVISATTAARAALAHADELLGALAAQPTETAKSPEGPGAEPKG